MEIFFFNTLILLLNTLNNLDLLVPEKRTKMRIIDKTNKNSRSSPVKCRNKFIEVKKPVPSGLNISTPSSITATCISMANTNGATSTPNCWCCSKNLINAV